MMLSENIIRDELNALKRMRLTELMQIGVNEVLFHGHYQRNSLLVAMKHF